MMTKRKNKRWDEDDSLDRKQEGAKMVDIESRILLRILVPFRRKRGSSAPSVVVDTGNLRPQDDPCKSRPSMTEDPTFSEPRFSGFVIVSVPRPAHRFQPL